MGFFRGFSFDTLLALISCITGIVALFVSNVAYKNCKISNNKVKSKKIFGSGSKNYSFEVGGDYIEGVDDKSLAIILKEMSSMTDKSFSTTLDGVYTMFQAKCDDNLQKIMDETKKIVIEQKKSIAGYTKIDWIHIYFESAKNTSDKYMQEVWAKVLAEELSKPNSFSYKTLDSLKNMSHDEFKLFENICAFNVGGVIFRGEYLKKNGIFWIHLQRLKEYGIISLDNSVRNFEIESNGTHYEIINNEYIIIVTNKKDVKVNYKIPSYIFTNVANELMKIVNINTIESTAIDIAREAEKNVNSEKGVISLHRLNFLYNDGNSANYMEKNLLVDETKSVKEKE